jgi:hypothetical protein
MNANVGLFGFKTVLSDYNGIRNFYKYIGCIIFGLIYYYFYVIKQSSQKEEDLLKKMKTARMNKGLIMNRQQKNHEINKYGCIHILIVCFFYALFFEIINISLKFDLMPFDLWIFNVIFIVLFTKYYYSYTQHSHQLLSLYFIFFVNLIIIVITFFVRKTYQRVLDNYYFIPILIIVFLLNTLMISFSRTKAKVLMEINNISPYKIIIITGLFGLLLNTIILTISTLFLCEGNSKEKCQIHILKGESDMKLYYDNYYLYFSSLDEQLSDILILEASFY